MRIIVGLGCSLVLLLLAIGFYNVNMRKTARAPSPTAVNEPKNLPVELAINDQNGKMTEPGFIADALRKAGATAAEQIDGRQRFLVKFDPRQVTLGALVRAVVEQNSGGNTYTVSLVLAVGDQPKEERQNLQNAMITALRPVSGVESGLTVYVPGTKEAVIRLSDIGGARLQDIIDALISWESMLQTMPNRDEACNIYQPPPRLALRVVACISQGEVV